MAFVKWTSSGNWLEVFTSNLYIGFSLTSFTQKSPSRFIYLDKILCLVFKQMISVSPQKKSRNQFWVVSNEHRCLSSSYWSFYSRSMLDWANSQHQSCQHLNKAYLCLRSLKSPRSFQEPLEKHPILSSKSRSSSDSVASSSAHSSTSSFIYSLWFENKWLWLKDRSNIAQIHWL